MKKLLLLILASCVLLAVGCENAAQTTTSQETTTAETTATEQTTAASTTTYPSMEPFPKIENWTPDTNQPWNFTPVCQHKNCDSHVTVTMANDTFAEVPESIELIIEYTPEDPQKNPINSTFCYYGVYLEKLYDYVYSPTDAEYPNAWIRLPLYPEQRAGRRFGPKITENIVFEEKLPEGVKLTHGKYRFVICVGNEPQYVYFEIKA